MFSRVSPSLLRHAKPSSLIESDLKTLLIKLFGARSSFSRLRRHSRNPLSNREICSIANRQEVAAAIHTAPTASTRERDREREREIFIKYTTWTLPVLFIPDSISIDKPLGGNISETDLSGGSLHYSSTVLIVIRKSWIPKAKWRRMFEIYDGRTSLQSKPDENEHWYYITV